MSRRLLLLVAAAVTGAAVGVIPALAADRSVVASSNVFTPSTVNIEPGEKVTWTNSSGTHNVHFDDDQFDQPPDAEPPASWPPDVSRTFPDAGTYVYYCDAHGSPAGGMRGIVIVGGGGTTTTTTTTSPTPTPSPAPTPTPSPPPGSPPPQVSVERTKARYCVGKRRRCKRPGFVLRVDASQEVALRGTLRRNGGRFAAIAWTAEAGTSTTRFRRAGGRKLKPGRYRLAITAPDHPDLAFDPLRFRIIRR